MSEPASDRRRFEIQRCLGAGGFGEVYLASMISAGGVRSEVALKVLHQGLDPGSQAVERLRDEARLLGLLNHPSILRIHDLVLLQDRVTLVTEFIDGADLDHCFNGDDPLPPAAALVVLGKVAEALNTAFTRVGPDGRPLHLLHRDIKPSNIRIGRHGEVKLLDFGIAKATGFDREAKTQTNTVVGSFPYMAPERFDDSGDSTAADVYSLGCVLFEALTGRRLYEDMEVRQLFALAMVQEKHDAKLAERFALVGDVHPEVRRLLTEMLRFDPDGRPPVDSLGSRCEDLADDVGGKNLSRWRRRHTWPSAEDIQGALSGRTITEASISQTSRVLPSSVLSAQSARPAPPPTGVVTPAAAPDPPPPAPPPEPAPAPPPPAAQISAPLPAQTGGGSSRGMVIAAVAAGVVLLGVVAVGVAAVLGGGAVAAFSFGGFDADEEVASTVEAAPAPEVADGAGEAATTTAAPDATHRTTPARAAATDGAVVVDDAADATADAGTIGADHSVCADPTSLEPGALLGTLTDPQRACLGRAMRDTSARQTDRAKSGRVLLVDARARCEQGDGCAQFEAEQRYYFEEVDRSDPDMLYLFAIRLSETDGGSDARREEAIAWADRALERKHSWRGLDYVKRVDRMLELGARVSYARFQASSRNEDLRIQARNRSVQWLNNRVQLGKDNTEALSLCASASGSEAECLRRMHEEKAEVSVTLTSVPLGATVRVDGRSVGTTPIVVPLAHGAHTLEMTVGETDGTKQITVELDGASRWTWRVLEDRWESSF